MAATSTPAQLTAYGRIQLVEERRVSLEHLRRIVDDYWEPEWRRVHREETEDHLWRAAAALVEIDDTLATLSS